MYESHKFQEALVNFGGIAGLESFLRETINRPRDTSGKFLHGRSAAQVASELELDPCTMRRWFDFLGIERRRNKPGFFGRAPSRSALQSDYATLGSVEQLGVKYGVSKETARHWLVESGIERNRPFYQDVSSRIEHIKSFLEKSHKNLDVVTYIDFFNTKRNDGRTYSGLLFWYARTYECSPSEAIKIMNHEFKESKTKKN